MLTGDESFSHTQEETLTGDESFSHTHSGVIASLCSTQYPAVVSSLRYVPFLYPAVVSSLRYVPLSTQEEAHRLVVSSSQYQGGGLIASLCLYLLYPGGISLLL